MVDHSAQTKSIIFLETYQFFALNKYMQTADFDANTYC